MSVFMSPAFPRTHHHMAPCWQQPGRQQWHLVCALTHPLRFLRANGPVRFRPR